MWGRGKQEEEKSNDYCKTVEKDSKGEFAMSLGEDGGSRMWDMNKGKLVAKEELKGLNASCVTRVEDFEQLVFGTGSGVIWIRRER